MVHLALMFIEKAFATQTLGEAISALSLTDYREFNNLDTNIQKYLEGLNESTDRCPNCSADILPTAKFCPECGEKLPEKSIISGLLEEPIEALSISDKLKNRIAPHFPRVGDIIQANRTELMEIKWIGAVRTRIIKNAAEEFISG